MNETELVEDFLAQPCANMKAGWLLDRIVGPIGGPKLGDGAIMGNTTNRFSLETLSMSALALSARRTIKCTLTL